MTSPFGKIVITPEDIAGSAPHAALAPASEAITILSIEGDRRKIQSVAAIIALTLIPFVNAWAWFRRAQLYGGTAKRTCLAMATLMGVVSLASLFWAGIYVVVPRKTWIEAIDDRVDRGVVLVATNVGDGPQGALSMGTGVVIANDDISSLVLTNKHVVGLQPAPEAWTFSSAVDCGVVLRSHEIIGAKVAGWHRSPGVDLALVLVASPRLQALGPVGRFQDVNRGDEVLAIGHPEGLLFSFSRGTVENKYEGEWLQISATLNQGNSGGPLLDNKGRLIAVNTSVYQAQVGSPHGFSVRADHVLIPDQWTGCPEAMDLLKKIQRD